MYDELKERCRACSQGCNYPSECSYFGKPPLRCMRQLLSEAADAIENMSEAYEKLSRHMDDLAALMPRWIPATERLPEAGEHVLCYCRGNIYGLMKMRTDGDWVYDVHHIYMHSFVTHWMPLPQRPKEE